MPVGSHFDYSPVLAEMVNERRSKGRSGKSFDGLDALSTVNNLVVLRNLMMDAKPERTLEVGLSFGGSCLVFCASHRDLNRTPSSQHVAIDPFQHDIWDDAGLAAAERQGLSGYLSHKSDLSSFALPQLLKEGAEFGLIYIDGSHLFEDVIIDAYYSTRLTTQRGVLLFDDCMNPHVAKVMRFMRANLRDQFEEVDLSPYRHDAARNLKYAVARMMGKQQLVGFRRIGKPERNWDDAFHNF